MIEIGSYTLDTLQIYFPWDDDLYTYFKDRGFGTQNYKMKSFPLIYTDNTISTVGVDALNRNYVIRPEYFNKTLEDLGWTLGKSAVRPVIPAEKIKVNVILLNDNGHSIIRFKIIPNVDGKEQYHIEYSSMASYGKMYSNWSIMYFTIGDMIDIMTKISEHLGFRQSKDYIIKTEERQNQRESMHHVEVPIINYRFTVAEFQHAVDYLQHNGFSGKFPSLVYDSSNSQHKEVMHPVLKYGIVHTTTSEGFMHRKPQFVMKIAQPKYIEIDGRKKKIKGLIEIDVPADNLLEVDANDILNAFTSMRKWYGEQIILQSYPFT
jgi:hypothetical protein